MELVVLGELGYLPSTQSRDALLFLLLSKLYKITSVMITTRLNFSEWANVFRDAKMTTALLARLTHRGHIVETGKHSAIEEIKRERRKKRGVGNLIPNRLGQIT